jgi:DNA-binding MarR family transcriptional regulator
LSINDLSALLFCNKSNATRLVDRLLEDGLVVREQDAADRRYVRVLLTESGWQVRQRAIATHEASLALRLAGLFPAEQARLEDMLTRLRDNLRQQLAETN